MAFSGGFMKGFGSPEPDYNPSFGAGGGGFGSGGGGYGGATDGYYRNSYDGGFYNNHKSDQDSFSGGGESLSFFGFCQKFLRNAFIHNGPNSAT